MFLNSTYINTIINQDHIEKLVVPHIVFRGWVSKAHIMNCDPKSRIKDKTEVKRIEWKAIVGHATKSQYNKKEKQRDREKHDPTLKRNIKHWGPCIETILWHPYIR